jgi:hypothetical protein
MAKKTSKTPIQSIMILGKRWFQRTYGNTYHRVQVYVNDKEVATSKITYGYGDQYIQTAVSLLKENGYLKSMPENTPLWRYCKENGIDCTIQYKDVKTERELKNF